ncbi:hypothetical protein NDU88_004322 [Pleurodeles waltl]|uniref:Uncharacterized protein n=1 Tax=Pleurodeles waltl TaxID=8319 RepID=A0AAV7L8E7_PLEWA|nr:hypothetical protein NDU88_004322 [Pleurodeles waltl]
MKVRGAKFRTRRKSYAAVSAENVGVEAPLDKITFLMSEAENLEEVSGGNRSLLIKARSEARPWYAEHLEKATLLSTCMQQASLGEGWATSYLQTPGFEISSAA